LAGLPAISGKRVHVILTAGGSSDSGVLLLYVLLSAVE
jgi:hypothetical protein